MSEWKTRPVFYVITDGLPTRFYINSRTKERKTDHELGGDRFGSVESAKKKCELYGLKEYSIKESVEEYCGVGMAIGI